MEIRQLEYFAAIVESRSFSEAARRLSVTQAAVSYQAAELEHRFGVRLFIRSSPGLQLTEAGKLLYEEGLEILQRMKALEQRVRALNAGIVGRLKVGYVESTETLISNALPSFHKEHSGIEVQIERMHAEALNQALRSGEIDIGLTFNIALSGTESLHCKTLYKEPMSATVAASHPLAAKPSLVLADLKDYPLILMDRKAGAAIRLWFEKAFAAARFTPRSIREAGDVESLLLMVKAGLGPALMNSKTVALFPNLGLVNRVITDMGYVETLIVWRDYKANPAIPIFVKQFLSSLTPAAR
jgi:DNA-binding transcriptional LysR family regulator